MDICASETGEGQDAWVQELATMYLGWAERRGYEATAVAEAEEPFRVVVRIAGPGAYGYLAGEAGLHRRIDEEKRQRAYVRVHRGGPVEEEESLDVDGREVRRHEGTYLSRVKTEVTVKDETTGRMMTLAGAGELGEMKDIASRVVKGQGGSNTADEARRYHLGRGARVEDPRTGAGTPRVKDVLRGELDVFIAAWISRPPTTGSHERRELIPIEARKQEGPPVSSVVAHVGWRT